MLISPPQVLIHFLKGALFGSTCGSRYFDIPGLSEERYVIVSRLDVSRDMLRFTKVFEEK